MGSWKDQGLEGPEAPWPILQSVFLWLSVTWLRGRMDGLECGLLGVWGLGSRVGEDVLVC